MKKILLAFLSLPLIGLSQLPITATGTYTQNFNTLSSSGTANAWVNNSTIANWYSQRTGTGTNYTANDGSSNTGNLYSYGVNGDPERALGTIGSGGTAAGNFAHGFQMVNNAPTNVSNIAVTYKLEQWRNGGSAITNTIGFYYKISSTPITDLTPNNNTGWTAVTALDGVSPIATGAASALVGNLPANQVVYTNISLPGVVLMPGEYIMLKWDDPDHTGSDHGMSIDDVTIDYTVTCQTYSTINATSCTDYTLNSTTYSSSGTYTQVLPNANIYGCDSTITLNLTITSGITYYQDNDNDTYGSLLNTIIACTQPVGYVLVGGDCDDNNDQINPGASEICNGIDDNCDGNIDEGVLTTYYMDMDSDGYGDITMTTAACSAPVGYVANGSDCNDMDGSIHPGAIDIPLNGIDEDCNGSDATSSPMIALYEFTGAGLCPNQNPNVTTQPTDGVFSAYNSVGTTCNATNDVFNNSGWNTTATIDLNEYNEFTLTANDCRVFTLDQITFDHRNSGTGASTWTIRSSVDNYSTDLATGASSPTLQNSAVTLGASFQNLTSVTFRFYVTSSATTGTTWRQDNVSVFGLFSTVAPQTYYQDFDADGYGNPSVSLTQCTQPAGYVSDNQDCNDSNSGINPTTIWYQDADNDNLGNALVSFTGCTPPGGYVLTSGDCDDNNNTIAGPVTYYTDADNDGFGDNGGIGLSTCSNPGPGFATNNTDCDDQEPSVYPGAPEICDGLDNDCNGPTDDGLVFNDYFVDADGDNYGSGSPISLCQDPGNGYSLNGDDCDDTDPNTYPGATDIFGNSIDENCDGVDGYVGINEISGMAISVSPNPTNNSLNIHFGVNDSYSVCLKDLNGKICFESNISAEFMNIDLKDFEAGIYLLNVKNQTNSFVTRIVKQ